MNTIAQRAIDELGRIVLPKEVRQQLEMNAKDIVDICIENDSIIIKKSKA